MAKKIIKAQMKQRLDTKANWAAQNPVLLAGELGIVSDDPNLYKVGDGATAWNALPFRGFDGNIVQELGDSATSVMSQKAITVQVAGQNEKLAQLDQRLTDVEENGGGTGGGGVIGNLTGYKSLNSTSELPTTASTLGYLIGSNLYVYVGEGGDVNNGTYKDCGEFRGPQGKVGPVGPQGEEGPQGPAGEKGADGTPGITSAEVSVDNNTGTPSVSATIEDKVLILNFTGLKGAQGNSGYQGAAGELEVVNNLTDGGETAALSAEMGKELYALLDREGSVDVRTLTSDDFESGGIDTDGSFVEVSTRIRTLKIKVTGEATWKIVLNSSSQNWAYNIYDEDGKSTYNSGWLTKSADEFTTNGGYIAFAVRYSNNSNISPEQLGVTITQEYIKRAGLIQSVTEQGEKVDAMEGQLSSLGEIVEGVDKEVEIINDETFSINDYKSYSSNRGFIPVRIKDYKEWDATLEVLDNSPIKVGVQGTTSATMGSAVQDSGWNVAGNTYHYSSAQADGRVAYILFVFTDIASSSRIPTMAEIKQYVRFKVVTKKKVAGILPRLDIIESNLGLNSDGFSYAGEKVNLRTNTFTSETIGTLSAGTSSRQGGAVFGDYLFQFHDTLATIVVYNLATKTNVQVLNLTANANCHAGSGGFGNEYADASDPFPLLYISSMNEKKVYVYRITGTEGSWSIALVQTLTLEIDFYVPNVAIDRENNMMVIFGYTKNSWSDANNNPSHIVSCPLPKLVDGDITISEWSHGNTIPYIYAQQGAFARFGKLYLSYGNTSVAQGGGAYVIDYVQGIAVSHIDFKPMGSFEPEAFCKYGDQIVMTDQSGNIYGLSFN